MSTFNDKDEHNPTGNISDSEEQLTHGDDRFRTETDTQDFQEEALELEEEESEKKSNGKTVKIIAGVGVAAVLLAGGAMFALNGGDHNSNNEAPPAKSNDNTDVKKETSPEKEVVKTSQGVNTSTSDPDLQNALKVKEKPEVKKELPFKDVQETKSDELTPPAPVQSGELTPPAPVQNSVVPPVSNGQGELTPPVQTQVAPPVVNHGELTPPVSTDKKELTDPNTANAQLTPPVQTPVVAPPVVDHGELTPPVDTSTKEVDNSALSQPKVNTVAPIESNVKTDGKDLKSDDQSIPLINDKDNGGKLIGDDQGGMIDPSEDATKPVVSSGSSDLNGSMDKILSQMNSLSENVKSLNDKVSKIDETVIVKKADFDKLVERVTALENLHKDSNGLIVACPCDPSKKEVKKDSVVKKEVKKESNVRKHNYKPRDSITVVKKTGDLSVHKERTYTHKEVRRTGASMKLESVVGDRAWVRTGNGTIRSYSVGDVLPNGKVIGNVDSQNGVYDKNGVKVLSR